MILYLLITIFICAYAFFDWKKVVIIWLPVSMLFNPCVCLKYSPPALTVVLAINFVLLILYYFREKKKKYELCNKPFIFKRVFIVYLISYGLSMMFSVVPFTTVFAGTVQYFLNTFIIVYLFHKAIRKPDDIKLFTMTAIIVFIPIILLSIYETVFHDNPWLDYVYFSVPNSDYIIGKMFYKPPFLSSSGDLAIRYGMVRCYSFFNIHIDFGCACLIYLFFFLFSIQYGISSGKLLSANTLSAISILCIVGIVLSNSKTPMVGFFFLVFAAIPPGKLFNTKGLVIAIMAIILFIILLDYKKELFYNFLALFDTEIQEKGGGSTAHLRMTQYKIGWDLFMKNPLLGNGIGALDFFLNRSSRYVEILGSESSWLKILPQQGLLGVATYIYLYKEIFVLLKKYTRLSTAVFYCLGLILMETATGFMNFSVYAPILVIIERYYQLNTKRIVKISNKK